MYGGIKGYEELPSSPHPKWKYLSLKNRRDDDDECEDISTLVKAHLYKILCFVGCCVAIFGAAIGVLIWQLQPSPNPFKSLDSLCEHVQPIQANEFHQRRLNLLSELQSLNLDVLVIEPGADMLYFTNVQWSRSERPFLNVYLRNGSYFWIAPAFEVTRAQELIPPEDTILFWQENQSPYEFLASIVQPLYSNVGIGYSEEIRYFIVSGIQTSLSSYTVKQDLALSIVAGLRIIKSTAELDILECANIATKHAIKVAAKQARVGMTEAELGKIVMEALVGVPLENPWQIVLFGASAAFPHGNTQTTTRLAHGHLVLIDAGGSLFNYQSDITRTFPFGTINAERTRAWETVYAAQTAGLQAATMGVECQAVDSAARNVTEQAGYGPQYELFKHRLGHGIGLQGHEHPYLVGGNKRPLGVGMAFSVEPGLYAQGDFGVRIEDIAYLGDDGVAHVFGPRSGPLHDVFRGH